MKNFKVATDIVPEERQTAIDRALHETFSTTELDSFQRITIGNMTSRVFRIVVNGSTYILKIILRKDDPTCHFNCMNVAAKAGLAPRVLYANIEDKVCITDFVNTIPLSADAALTRIPQTLRQLHALPLFPNRAPHLNTTFTFLLNEGPALDAFIERIQAASFLPDRAGFVARLGELSAAFPREDSDIVSSHNDLFKPDNVLFDGRQIWLVDWEAAFRNDRYVDLAVVANMIVTTEAEESTFLQEYFGAPPNVYQRARLFLARQLAHMFYAAAFLMLGSIGKPIDWAEPIPAY